MRQQRVAVLAVMALSTLIQLSSADAATVTAGSACISLPPSQAKKFEWRTEGLTTVMLGIHGGLTVLSRDKQESTE